MRRICTNVVFASNSVKSRAAAPRAPAAPGKPRLGAGAAAAPMKRSGRNAVGSSYTEGRKWPMNGSGATIAPAGSATPSTSTARVSFSRSAREGGCMRSVSCATALRRGIAPRISEPMADSGLTPERASFCSHGSDERCRGLDRGQQLRSLLGSQGRLERRRAAADRGQLER
eukprot:scaffold714_cov121-Isochrysis_galbana.AAC.1